MKTFILILAMLAIPFVQDKYPQNTAPPETSAGFTPAQTFQTEARTGEVKERRLIAVEDDTEDSYSCEGSFDDLYPCSNAVDEDWDTYALAAESGYIYENYTIPPGALRAEFTIKFGHGVPVTPGICCSVSDYWDGTHWKELNCTALTNRTSILTVKIPDDALSGTTLQLRTKTWGWNGKIGHGSGVYYEGKVTWYLE
jgi:hypothetical protein